MNNEFKPKVLMVHNYYQIPGGEDTVVANEKKLLEDNGHEVILYSRNNSEIKEFNFFQKLFLPFTSIFSLKTFREVKKIIKTENIDIVHVHNTLTLISPAVYYAAFATKKSVVQTIHNFRLQCPAATFYRDGHICEECVSKGLKCAVKHGCYRESKVQTLVCVFILKVHRIFGTYRRINYICLTEFNKGKLLEINNSRKSIITPEKVFVKPNFSYINRKIVPFEERKNQFVFVGRLDKLKGVDILLNAWKLVKDSDLIICGKGSLEDWCKQFVSDNNMLNVKMLGYVENTNAIEIIAESKALILPTQCYEGFPMTLVESWACGTPVIGSDVGNVNDLVKKHKTGLTFKCNSSEKLINTLIEFEKLDKKMLSRYTCKIFKDYFSNKRNYEILIGIYGRIV